jgi:hypothetical protein
MAILESELSVGGGPGRRVDALVGPFVLDASHRQLGWLDPRIPAIKSRVLSSERIRRNLDELSIHDDPSPRHVGIADTQRPKREAVIRLAACQRGPDQRPALDLIHDRNGCRDLAERDSTGTTDVSEVDHSLMMATGWVRLQLR